jgi:Tol biopolymer transport system component
MSRRIGLLLCVTASALLVVSAPAVADVFGPTALVSEGTTPSAGVVQQADYANHPVISANGQYVAFDGSFGATAGVWRRDLATGVVEQVAPGDAALPSISANGQYVSFTTTEKLVPEDTNSGPDVYVRNMELPAEVPGAFKLASAITVAGRTQGLSYEYAAAPGSPERTGEEASRGAEAAGRSALSANGQKVVFVTTAASDLAGPHTPALQVAVRNFEHSEPETQLVSVLANPATGAPELNAEGQDMPVPTTGAVGAVYHQGTFPNSSEGASISADGTTVTWMGQEIAKQAQVLSGDVALASNYSEPLWRRIDEGPQAPTRRITGGSEPANPACVESGETKLAARPTLSEPCQGPFTPALESGEPGIWTLGAEHEYLPQLSANGMTVAFIANARYLPGGEEFDHAESSDDLYVANMQEGLTRIQALRRLTAIASGETSDVARFAPILDFGVSPDGSQIAFTTQRTVFPLGSPAYVDAPLAVAGMSELYDVDLSDNTLTRVTHGYQSEEEPGEQPHRQAQAGIDPYGESQGAISPSFTEDGNTLAFASTASNLVYGDGSPHPLEDAGDLDGSEAFLVSRKDFSTVSTETYVSPVPPGPQPAPVWQLGATALSRKDGSVLLEVEVPGAGTLNDAAQSAVIVGTHGSARKGRSSSRRQHGHAALARPALATRTVASRGAHPAAGGLVTLTLDLAKPYASLATRSGGLSATVDVVFTAPGHPVLRRTIVVSFVRSEPVRRTKASKRDEDRSANKRRRAR